MSACRVSEEAETELDAIWLYIAQDSSIETASRVIDSIIARLWKLAAYPYMGRSRDKDLGPGLRSFPAGNYTILYEIDRQVEEEQVHILRVIDSRRDLLAILSKKERER